MQQHALALQRLGEPVQVGVVILLGEKAGLAVVAALHDMQRNAIEMKAGATGHVLARDHWGGKSEPGPFNSPARSSCWASICFHLRREIQP